MAVLVRRVGLRHLETVEDAVQASLLAALTAWVTSGIPDTPGAWLHRVAHNHLLGVLRRTRGTRAVRRRQSEAEAVHLLLEVLVGVVRAAEGRPHVLGRRVAVRV